MRAILLTSLTGWMLLAGVAYAEPDDKSRMRARTDLQKPGAQRPAINPCAQFGPGFARVEGSDTCVQIGGSFGIGLGGRVGAGR